MFYSLRARLALWLLLPLALLVALCGYAAHEHAEDAADYVQDHDLLSSAESGRPPDLGRRRYSCQRAAIGIEPVHVARA